MGIPLWLQAGSRRDTVLLIVGSVVGPRPIGMVRGIIIPIQYDILPSSSVRKERKKKKTRMRQRNIPLSRSPFSYYGHG